MQLRDDCYYRLNDLIPRDPGSPRIIPMARSTWWEGVKQGKFPQPIKLSTRVTVWKGRDLRKFLETGSVEG